LNRVLRTIVASISIALIYSCLNSGSPSQTANAATALAITTTSIPVATYQTDYSTTLKATGGTLPYNWKVIAGAHPTGFALDAGRGVLYGTPEKGGTYPLTFSVTDSSKPAQTETVNLTVVVATPTFSITTTSLTTATKGLQYSSTLQAIGGTPNYLWSVTSGCFPSGVTMAATTGLISGIPKVTGTFPITFAIKDYSSPTQTKSISLTFVVTAAASIPPLTITTSSLPSGTEGTTYSGTLQASGGTPAYTWSISVGSLPAGLTLAATTGVISGTPSVTGTTSFTATVSDNGNPAQTKSASVLIALSAAPPPSQGTTWYIRADGGTNTQCTGKTNAAYPGSGTNQACAFNHPFQMLNYDGTWTSFKGGDTIQFADSGSASQTYYMGEQNSGIGNDWHSQLGDMPSAQRRLRRWLQLHPARSSLRHRLRSYPDPRPERRQLPRLRTHSPGQPHRPQRHR
jgi:hypothetical protein